MKKVFGKILIWLVFVNLFGLIFLNRLNVKADTAYSWIGFEESYQDKSWNILSISNRWDAKWYLDIAENGYSYNEASLSNIVYFPLYPLLIRYLSVLFFGNTVFTGWILSMGFFLAAIYFFRRIVSEFHSNLSFDTVLHYILFFPTALVFTVIYTESLFLFLSLATIYFARKGDFTKAAVLGLFGSLTRVTGFLLFVPLLVEYIASFQKGKFLLKNLIQPKMILVFLPIFGFLGFLCFHYLQFGDFLLFFKVQKIWGRVPFVLNQGHFSVFSQPAIINLGFDLAYLVLSVWVLYKLLKGFRISYALYFLTSILLPVFSGSLASFGRYLGVLFPLYLVLATIKNSQVKFAVHMVFSLVFALNIALWANNYWVF
jgi:Gpi18-like mannosyltransferase